MPNILLRHLPATCPVCDARLTSLNIGEEHAHKELGRFEDASYKCGSSVSWVPNFNRMETRQPCAKQLKVQTVRLQFDLDLQVTDKLDMDRFIRTLKLRPEVDWHATDRYLLSGNVYIKEAKNIQRV